MVGHPEGLSIPGKRHAGGRDKIFGGKPGLWQVRPGKAELFLPVRVELAVQKFQTLQAV